MNKFTLIIGNETTVANIPDDNYFSEGKGSALYRKDDLNQKIPSQPAKLTGSQTSFDFGEEGNKLIEITNDPMRFNATREAEMQIVPPFGERTSTACGRWRRACKH